MNKNFERTWQLNDVEARRARAVRTATTGGAAGTWLERCLLRLLLSAFEEPRFAFVLWTGEEVTPPEGRVSHRIHVRDRASLLKLLCNPREQFGDLYSSGALDVEGSLADFLVHAYLAVPSSGHGNARGIWRLWRDHKPRSTSKRAARENIHHHYDVGNAFYGLWLDRASMQYTCAYFPTPDATLEQAQVAKMHHVCRKLRLRPGMEVIEAGCGWGGLALFMAREYGVRVTAYNISEEQVGYGREQARREGLHDRVEFVEADYREIRGRCDAFVSVGMLEHVGRAHYRDLGDVVHRSLSAHGLALIHTIGRNRPQFMNSWIEKRIFPGAYPPSLSEMAEIFEPRRFAVLDVENLRLHYAATLEHWLRRYMEHESDVRKMFDERFVRTWRLYLAGSYAAFTVGALQLFQVCFTRERNNEIPWTRAHLYRE
jgi:cyclopropane-fatty-acyl-phospholipid synthase